MNEFACHEKRALMARVISVRQDDLPLEKALCLELLAWAQAKNDLYAKAFAHTYLGDYYVAQNDSLMARTHLLEAQALIGGDEAFDALRLRMDTLLALYYKSQADEQTSVSYYLDAIALAQKLSDVKAECSVLNNLGFAFRRHQRPDVAFDYFEKAYQLQKEQPDGLIYGVLLSNLMELCVQMGRMQEAKAYLEESEPLLRDMNQEGGAMHLICARCGYYAAAGDRERALSCASYAKAHEEQIIANPMSAFENYDMLFYCMVDIQQRDDARYFLNMMERTGQGGGLDQLKMLRDARSTFALRFEPSEQHILAYRDYFHTTGALRERNNQAIVDAMKSRIQLEDEILRNEAMQNEQAELTMQANMDELTQLYNRRFLEQMMRKRTSDMVGGSLGIVMLDVDYFKEYNDYYGHIQGDKALKAVAGCLWAHRVEGIYPCRFGGDEFACLCDGLTDRQVEDYVRAVRDSLAVRALPHEKSPCGENLTLSIGYAVEREADQADPYLLLQLADQALYATKLSGRNAYTRKRVDEA